MTCGKILPLASPVCQMSFDESFFGWAIAINLHLDSGKFEEKKTQGKIIKNKKGKENLKKNFSCLDVDDVNTKNQKEKEMGFIVGVQTFSNGYTVFRQAEHLSWVPENIEESLLGALDCKRFQNPYA